MRTKFAIMVIASCVIAGCDRRNDGPSSTASDSATAQAWKNYNEQVKQQQEAYDRQAKIADEHLQAQSEEQNKAAAMLLAQEDEQKRADALMTIQEQMMSKQRDDLARFEKILDTWGSQQKQYQKDLDSLPK